MIELSLAEFDDIKGWMVVDGRIFHINDQDAAAISQNGEEIEDSQRQFVVTKVKSEDDDKNYMQLDMKNGAHLLSCGTKLAFLGESSTIDKRKLQYAIIE